MGNCIDTTTVEFKGLKNKFGKKLALLLSIKNGGNSPSIEKADKMLEDELAKSYKSLNEYLKNSPFVTLARVDEYLGRISRKVGKGKYLLDRYDRSGGHQAEYKLSNNLNRLKEVSKENPNLITFADDNTSDKVYFYINTKYFNDELIVKYGTDIRKFGSKSATELNNYDEIIETPEGEFYYKGNIYKSKSNILNRKAKQIVLRGDRGIKAPKLSETGSLGKAYYFTDNELYASKFGGDLSYYTIDGNIIEFDSVGDYHKAVGAFLGTNKLITKDDLNKYLDAQFKKGNVIKLARIKGETQYLVGNPNQIKEYSKVTEEELNWFKNKFGNTVSLGVVKDLINGENWGNFSKAGVLIYEGAGLGTVYHEAFHTVSQLFLNSYQRGALYNEVRSRLGEAELTDTQVEEVLADEFMDYMMSDGKIVGLPKAKSERQLNFFEKLFRTIMDFIVGKQVTVEELFENIKKDSFTKVPLSARAERFLRIHTPSSLNKKSPLTFTYNDEVVSVTDFEVENILRGVDFFFAKTAFSADNLVKTSNFKSTKQLDSIYDKVYNDLVDYANSLFLDNNDALDRFKLEQGYTTEDINYIKTLYRTLLDESNEYSNWIKIVKLHKSTLSEFGINIEDLEGSEDNSADTNEEFKAEDGRNNFVSSIEINQKDSVPRQIKLLLSSVPAIDREGNRITNSLGLPISNEWENTYNFIVNRLAGSGQSYEKLISKFGELLTIKPELGTILDVLNKDTKDVERLKTQFIQTFSKHKFNYYLELLERDGNSYFVDSNRSKLTDKIKKDWEFNYKFFNRYNNLESAIDKAKELRRTSQKQGLTEYKRRTLLMDSMAALGIKFSNTALINSEVRESFNNILDNVNLKAENIYSEDAEVTGSLNKLIEIQANNSVDYIDLQHLNPEGKSVYGISLHSYGSSLISDLSQISKLETRAERQQTLEVELPHIYNSLYAKDSILLERVLDGREISFDILEGIREDVVGESGIYTRDTTPADKLSLDINAVLNNKFSLVRTSDRGIENAISLDSLLVESREDFVEKMKEYLYTELITARNLVQDGLGDNIIYYRDNAKGLRVFKDIIKDPNILSLITKKRINFEDIFYSDEIQASIDLDINTYIDSRIQAEEILMKSLGITDSYGDSYQGISKELQTKFGSNLIPLYVYNSIVSKIEQTKLFGDLAYYKNADDSFKRFMLLNGTKKISRLGEDFNAFLNKEYKRLDEKSTSREIIKTIIFDDISVKSSYIGDSETGLTSIFTKELIKQGFGKGKELNSEGKAKLKGYLKPYNNMTEADGQGFISLDEYRDLLLRAGEWSDEHERVYQLALEGKTLNSKTLEVIFNPLKTQYTGPLVEGQEDGLYIHAGYKHSLIPLIPSLIKGTKLEGLHKSMIKNQVGIAQFISGNKFGTILNEEGKPNSFYLPDNSGITKIEDGVTQSIYYKYFGIQVDTGYKSKDEVITGTQQRKLIESDIFEFGKAVNEELGALGEEYNNLNNELIRLYTDEFKSNMGIIKLVDNNYQIVDGTKFVKFIQREFKSRNAPENVIKAINSLNIIDGDGESIGLEKIDTLINRDKVENLLLSLVTNRIIKQKKFGSPKIQVANTGFEVNIRSAEGGIFVSNELKFYELNNESGELSPMEIMITAPKVLLRRYKTVEALNEALVSGELDKRLTEVVGFRIPNQGLNSSDYMKIVKFLPPESGDIVIMPSEIVAKAGSDFDIDKMNIYFPEVDYEFTQESITKIFNILNYVIKKDGSSFVEDLFYIGEQESVNKLSDILYRGDQNYDDLDDYEQLVYDTVKNQSPQVNKLILNTSDPKKSINNKILEVNKKILLHPENAARLLAPISDGILIDSKNPDNTYPIVNLIRKLYGKGKQSTSFTNVVEPETNLRKFQYFLSGKAGVGQVAVHITSHVLFQKANVYVKSPITIYGKHNTVEIDGEVFPSLAGVKDVNGNYISESLSAFINSYVDIAKDPYIFDLNAGNEVTNTIMYLLRLGANPKWVALLINQPSVINYIQLHQKYNSKFKKIRGITKSKKSLAQEAVNSLGTGIRISDSFEFDLRTKYSDTDKDLFIKLEALGYAKELTEGQLESAIVNRGSINSQSARLQKQALDNFLEYQRQSRFIQKAVRAVSPDTKSVGKNINILKQYRKERQEVLISDDFLGNIDKVFETSFVGEFAKVVDMTYSAYSKIMLTEHPNIKNGLDRIKDNLTNVQQTLGRKQRVLREVDNHFIKYLILTHKDSASNYNNNFNQLFSKEGLIKSIKDIQEGTSKKYPRNLRNNLFISELVPIFAKDKSGKENPYITIFNRNFTTRYINKLTDSFTELYNQHKPLAIALAKYSIIQSGISNSPIGFGKLLDNDVFRELTNDIIKQVDGGTYTPNLDLFEDQFYRNNTSFIPTLRSEYFEGERFDKTVYSVGDKFANLPYLKKNSKSGSILYKNIGETNEGKSVQFSRLDDYQGMGNSIYYSTYTSSDFKNTDTTEKDAKDKIKECK